VLTSASGTISEVEDIGEAWRCYLEQTDGKQTNEFAVGDQAYSQMIGDIDESTLENVFYWRKVVGIGINYIDLSKTDAATNSNEPHVGDNVVQLGNPTDTSRAVGP